MDIETTYCNLNSTQEVIQETASELADTSFLNIICLNSCNESDSDCLEQHKNCVV